AEVVPKPIAFFTDDPGLSQNQELPGLVVTSIKTKDIFMKINLFVKTVATIVASTFLLLGISACSKSTDAEKPAKISDSKIEESIDKTIDESQEVISDSWITTK